MTLCLPFVLKQKEEKRKYPRTWPYSMFRPLASVLFRLIYPFRVIDRDKIRRPEAPYLLIANHNSNFDALVLAWLCPYELWFLGKKELIKGRFTRWFLQDRLHMIPISRTDNDINAMRACMNALKRGNVLCVFPEGTRHHKGIMEEMESGIGLIALRSNVPVYPVYIDRRVLPFRVTHCWVGDPIPYDDIRADGVNSETSARFMARITETYRRMMADAARR